MGIGSTTEYDDLSMLPLTSSSSLHLDKLKSEAMRPRKTENKFFQTLRSETLNSCNFSNSRNCEPIEIVSGGAQQDLSNI